MPSKYIWFVKSKLLRLLFEQTKLVNAVAPETFRLVKELSPHASSSKLLLVEASKLVRLLLLHINDLNAVAPDMFKLARWLL